MTDCRRIVARWARCTPEGLDYEIRLEADSGATMAERIRADLDCRYELIRVDWTDHHQARRQQVIGFGVGPEACARLRTEGAYLDLLLLRGIPTADTFRRRALRASVPPPEAVGPASPGAPEGDDFTAEAIDRLCQADRGGAR